MIRLSKKEPHPQTPMPTPEDLEGMALAWHERLLSRFTHFIRTADAQMLAMAALLFVLLSITLGFDHLSLKRLIENGASIRDIYAPYSFEVEDELATQTRQQQAQAKVLPIYRPVEPINNLVMQNLVQLFKGLEQIEEGLRQQTHSTEHYRHVFRDLVGSSPEANQLFDELFLRQPLSKETWIKLHLQTQGVTERLLKKGLSTEDYFDRKDSLIAENLPVSGLSLQQAHWIQFFVSAIMQPNQVLDDEAMLQAKQAASKQVPLVTRSFKKGDKIVGRGELILPIQIAALEASGLSVKGINWLAMVGIMMLTGFFIALLWVYLKKFETGHFFKPKYAALLGTLLTGFVVLVRILPLPLIGFPLAALGLTITVFTQPRVGILVTCVWIFLIGLILKLDFSILSVLLLGTVVGIYMLNRRLNFADRNHLMLSGLLVGLSNAMMILALQFLNSVSLHRADWQLMGFHMGWGVLSGLLSATVTLGILPVFEALFRLVTPYTLMELANHDKPLLRRMQFEAPGTFHHSIMVASMAEAAAEAIGANPLLTRVGCLYHDIGKLKRPQFFIENQAYLGVDNPHDKLTPRLSKMVITAHPRDGMEIARQYGLPEVVVKFILEHHGTTVTGYFYNLACVQEGAETVNKSQFRYPGPKPNIKETAIVMLADACESAVRSMKSPTVSQIEERIDKIIQQRVEDGQFDNCPITFKDINLIKETFMRILRGIQHNRIEYQQTMMRELNRKVATPGASESSSSPPAPPVPLHAKRQQSSPPEA